MINTSFDNPQGPKSRVTKQVTTMNKLITKLLVGLCPGQLTTTNKRLATEPKRSVKTETNQVKNVQVNLKHENNDHWCKNPYKMLLKNGKGLIKAKNYNLRPLLLQLWTPASRKHRLIATPLQRAPTTRLLVTPSQTPATKSLKRLRYGA